MKPMKPFLGKLRPVTRQLATLHAARSDLRQHKSTPWLRFRLASRMCEAQYATKIQEVPNAGPVPRTC